MTQTTAEQKDEAQEVTEGSFAMSIGPTVAQAQIRILVAVLKMVRDFLQSVLAALPPSAHERNPRVDFDAEPDITSELRRIGERVVTVCLDPAITDLSAAAEYLPGEPPSS